MRHARVVIASTVATLLAVTITAGPSTAADPGYKSPWYSQSDYTPIGTCGAMEHSHTTTRAKASTGCDWTVYARAKWRDGSNYYITKWGSGRRTAYSPSFYYTYLHAYGY